MSDLVIGFGDPSPLVGLMAFCGGMPFFEISQKNWLESKRELVT